MGLPEFPRMTDGRGGLRRVTVLCLNILDGSSNPIKLHYIDDSIMTKSVAVDHDLEGDGDPLGGDVHTGRKGGDISCQLEQADDPVPFPGCVLVVTKPESGVAVTRYYVTTDVAATYKLRNVTRFKVPVKLIYNPLFSGLQGSLGDYFLKSIAHTATATFDPLAVNFRAGATKAFTLVAGDTAVPAGLTIDAATGVISYATVAAGSYEVIVRVTDTVAGQNRVRTGEATLALTVT